MSTPLASFFTKIGFEVDKSSLVALEKNLSRLETRIKSMASSFSGMSNSQHIKAAAQLANAEAKRINAEVGLTRQKMGLAKVEAGVEKARQLTQKESLKLQQKKETTAGYYAKVNAASLLGNAKVKTAQDIAALKEALTSSTSKLRLNETSEKARIATQMMTAKAETQRLARVDKIQTAEKVAALKESLAARMSKLKLSESGEKARISAQLMNTKAEAEVIRRKAMTEADLARKYAIAANIKLNTARIEAQAALVRVRNTGKEIQNRIRSGSPSSNPTGGAVDPLFTMQNFKSVLALDAGRRFVQSSFNVGNFQTAQMPQYEFLTGSSKEAQKQIDYVNRIVDRLKLNLKETSAMYTQFLGATVSTVGIERTQKVFESLQAFGVMMGATGDQLKRGTKAVQQMLSKQKLSAEELTGQMAEANLIPGATQVFADVLEGGDVKKLFANMQKGKYTLEDIVKVLDSLEAKIKEDQLQKMLMRPTAELTELSTAWQRFLVVTNEEGGLAAMKAVLDGATVAIKAMTKVIKPLGTVIATTFKNAYEYVSMFAGILNKLLFNSIGSTILSVTLFGLVLSQIPKAVLLIGKSMTWLWRMFLVPAAVISAILLVEDLIGALLGKDSVIADAAKNDGFLGGLAATFLTIGQFLATIGHVLTAGIIEGDWDLAAEYIKTFFDNIKENFPNVTAWVDGIIEKFSHIAKLAFATGKFVVNPTNPAAAMGLYEAYQGYSQYKDIQNASVGTPASVARQSSGGMTSNSTVINAPISINGTGLDPKQIADAVTEQLNNRTLMAQANYVQLRK